MIHFPEGFNGHRYASHFLDDMTRMNWVYTHSTKNQTTLLQIFQEFDVFIKWQFDQKIRIFRIDGETALGQQFDTWGMEEGLKFETSTPYSPEQNSSAERSGGVIVTKSRCICIKASLPEDMWPETVKATAYLLNCTPARQLGWKSPVEALQMSLGHTMIRLDIAHLKVYRCKVYVHIPEEIRKQEWHHKLAPRAKIGYLIGYQSTNIYRVWIPQDEEVRSEKDVIFDETTFFDPRELEEPVSEVIIIMKIPVLSMMPSGRLILEDFRSEWMLSDNATPIDIPDSDKMPLSQSTLALPTPRSTPSPHTLTSDLPTTNSLSSEEAQNSVGLSDNLWRSLQSQPGPSHEIHGDVVESNIIDSLQIRKPSKCKEAYIGALSKPPEQLLAFHKAYTVGVLHRDLRLHRDQLP